MMLYIAIILSFIMLIGFGIFMNIFSVKSLLERLREDIKDIKGNQNVPTNKSTAEMDNTFKENFMFGVNQALNVVFIALYKMYSNLEILDYDSISDCLNRHMNEFSNNPEELKKWNDKLAEYIKDRKGESE